MPPMGIAQLVDEVADERILISRFGFRRSLEASHGKCFCSVSTIDSLRCEVARCPFANLLREPVPDPPCRLLG
jgi:hypothetical protein